MPSETLISVDVETSGPIPGRYALLSIGACLVEDTATTFYVELQPDREETSPEAMAIHGLNMETLKSTGTPPAQGLHDFSDWVHKVIPPDSRPIFVAFNAPFDWMFIHDYYMRYLGENPFGHSALDIKAYFMGKAGVDWGDTSFTLLASRFLEERHLSHNALKDAQDQAEIFRKIIAQGISQRQQPSNP